MQNRFDLQGFMNAFNQMKQLPKNQWQGFVQNMYQSQNKNFTEAQNQAEQLIKTNSPMITQFANAMSQYGIKF